MLINKANLDDLFRGFKTSFQKGFDAAPSYYRDISTVVPSISEEETYGWLGQFPKMREWVGDRVVRNLTAHSYRLKNREFETTVRVKRTNIEDDKYGVFAPIFEQMGREAKEHPDELVFDLLKRGFSELAYDGQYFFDADHPVGSTGGDYPVSSVSNVQAGAGPGWYLLDCSRAIKPMIFQERVAYNFQALTAEGDENVFMRGDYLYGVRARANAGFGLWQLAFGSKADLTTANYRDARKAMRELRGDEGRPLGVRPTHLVVPPALEEKAMVIVNAERDAAGATNVWKGTAALIVSEWLAE